MNTNLYEVTLEAVYSDGVHDGGSGDHSTNTYRVGASDPDEAKELACELVKKQFDKYDDVSICCIITKTVKLVED